MNRRNKKCSLILFFKFAVFVSTTTLSLFPLCKSLPVSMTLLKASPAIVKPQPLSVKSQFDFRYRATHQSKPKQSLMPQWPEPIVKKYFQIGPADAMDSAKYSQPAFDNVNPYPGLGVPSKTFSQTTTQITSHQDLLDSFHKNSPTLMRDLRLLEASTDSLSQTTETINPKISFPQSDMPLKERPSNLNRNNFTDSKTNLLLVSSEAILTYENVSINTDIEDSKYLVPMKSVNQTLKNVSSQLENVKPTYSSSNSSTLLHLSSEVNTLSSVISNTHIYINRTKSFDEIATSTVLSSNYEIENVSSSLASLDNNSEKLSSGSVAGIVIGVLVCVTILSSSVIYLLYRKYNGKCTSVVEGKFNSDNCGYLDDSLRSSIYLNNHIELPKESSEEMSSLDNDSFLNSLETMTIQNYWADNSKNTKV